MLHGKNSTLLTSKLGFIVLFEGKKEGFCKFELGFGAIAVRVQYDRSFSLER
jgi:hypothetical protein